MVTPGRHAVFRQWARRGRFFCQRQLWLCLLLQYSGNALVDEIMHQARLVETHLVLGGVHVNVNLVRVDLQIKHKGGLLIGAELIFAGLSNSVVNQAVAHHAAVDVAILNFCERGAAGVRIGNPATQGQIAMLPLNGQRLFQKRCAADGAQPTLLLSTLRHRAILAHHLTVMAEVEGDIKARQRDAADDLVDMSEFGLLGSHKLAPGGRVIEEIQHFKRGAYRVRRRFNRDVHIAPFGVGLPGFLLVGRAGGQR